MAVKISRHLLRVNLSTGKTAEDTILERDVEMLIGGRSLGALILYNEIPFGTDPLEENNKLIFSTGPLAGTAAPGSSRYCVLTKSPLTGLYLMAISGGPFGPEVARTGHAVLVIEGKSEKPVYLTITDGSVQIRGAGHLWGMPADLTQELIKDEIGGREAKITCIGPAGENQVPYASIMSERRAAGRGGAGAVMGSKNLKAIAVRGTGRAEVADPDRFRKSVKEMVNSIEAAPILERMVKHGSPAFFNDLNEHGILPCRNWQEAEAGWARGLYTSVFEDFIVKHMRCSPPCPTRCSKLTLVKSGPYAGAVSEGPEYETLYSLGACCGIADMAAIIEADSLCDRYGLDTISFGVSLAFAMECYEKEIITKEDTGGKELKFGDATLLAGLIRDTALRRGFGEILAEGTRRMSQRFGKGSEAFAMHAKGMELGGYDPRGAKAGALTFACGSRGGCHHAGGYPWMAEMYNPDPRARFSVEDKGSLVKRVRERRVICDSAIICTFEALGFGDTELAGLLSGATGLDLAEDDLYVIGERGSNIERAFNVREGLRRNWDTLPERLLKESVSAGSTRGQVVELEPLLDDFYSVCGWDLKTGIPSQERLNQLGLQKIADDLHDTEQLKLQS